MTKTRDEKIEGAEKAGADGVSAISGEVDYLICGDQIAHNATNAKYKEAIKLGFETLGEVEYLKLLKTATYRLKFDRAQTGSNTSISREALLFEDMLGFVQFSIEPARYIVIPY